MCSFQDFFLRQALWQPLIAMAIGLPIGIMHKRLSRKEARTSLLSFLIRWKSSHLMTICQTIATGHSAPLTVVFHNCSVKYIDDKDFYSVPRVNVFRMAQFIRRTRAQNCLIMLETTHCFFFFLFF